MRIDQHPRPVKLGEMYHVPCVVKRIGRMVFITPVINHPHSDRENGQTETHYHADFRFIRHKALKPLRTHSRHVFGHELRPSVPEHGTIEWHFLPVVNEDQSEGATNPAFIKHSKLKHKCIHNGKCPHRGYDLSQTEAVEGVITCPMHGLRFDANTKQKL
jgi:hypothetical protein